MGISDWLIRKTGEYEFAFACLAMRMGHHQAALLRAVFLRR